MPELPEVETVRRGLAPIMTGAQIVGVEQRRPDLRFPFPREFCQRLVGRRIESLGRRAKYLLADLDSGDVLVMHLGMSGSFRIATSAADEQTPGDFYHERSKDPLHDHIVFHLGSGIQVIYNDPRRFGFMDIIPRPELAGHKLFANIGIEPLGNELNGAKLADLFARRKTPLKAALLDQKLIAGLGNIYVCEALHRASLSPKRMAGSLAGKGNVAARRAEELSGTIRQVLEEAIAAGGSTLRDHRMTDGSLGYFQHTFRVYDREGAPCPTSSCNGIVKRIVQSGRSTFYCSKCQK